MQICTICQVKLTIDNAYIKKGRKLQSRCKKCFNKYCINRWIERKKSAIKYKGNKCYDCNQSFPYPVYDFHHIEESKKEMDWSKMRLVSDKKLKHELDKCVLLCATCHRLRHYQETLIY